MSSLRLGREERAVEISREEGDEDAEDGRFTRATTRRRRDR